MKYITAKGQKMSRFSLGTVQIGMTYGLGEHKEKPSEEGAFALLDHFFSDPCVYEDPEKTEDS